MGTELLKDIVRRATVNGVRAQEIDRHLLDSSLGFSSWVAAFSVPALALFVPKIAELSKGAWIGSSLSNSLLFISSGLIVISIIIAVVIRYFTGNGLRDSLRVEALFSVQEATLLEQPDALCRAFKNTKQNTVLLHAAIIMGEVGLPTDRAFATQTKVF